MKPCFGSEELAALQAVIESQNLGRTGIEGFVSKESSTL